jgi:hypothetical protein
MIRYYLIFTFLFRSFFAEAGGPFDFADSLYSVGLYGRAATEYEWIIFSTESNANKANASLKKALLLQKAWRF